MGDGRTGGGLIDVVTSGVTGSRRVVRVVVVGGGVVVVGDVVVGFGLGFGRVVVSVGRCGRCRDSDVVVGAGTGDEPSALAPVLSGRSATGSAPSIALVATV
ncbi:MAG: hypothetical protein GEV04_03590 [Actinophytocola sp.]|nr:hypothetical protein [Actinophytocola sp.]